jgi:hypothetical protein
VADAELQARWDWEDNEDVDFTMVIDEQGRIPVRGMGSEPERARADREPADANAKGEDQ